MTYTVHSLIADIADQLMPRYQTKQMCTQYAWWMLEAILKKTKSQLLIEPITSLTPEQKNTIARWIEKQVKEEMPLEYLIGSVPFGDCVISIKPPLLIPRPETEQWCYEIIKKLQPFKHEKLTILDLCTGSGCIAIALAKALPHATIYASDISALAIESVLENARSHNLTNIIALASDLFCAIDPQISFDMIIANPPYIAHEEWKGLDASVKNWEDPAALWAEEDGLAIIKRIVSEAKSRLNHQTILSSTVPQLIIEIGYQQGAAVQALFKKAGLQHVHIKKDLHEHDRVVVGSIYNEEKE